MKKRPRRLDFVNARKKQHHGGPKLLHIVIQQNNMPIRRMTVQPGIVQPAISERISQAPTQQKRPGIIVIQEMTFGSAAPYRDHREIVIPVPRRLRPAKTQAVARIDDDRIQLGVDPVGNDDPLVDRQNDLVALQPEMKGIIEPKPDLQQHENHNKR